MTSRRRRRSSPVLLGEGNDEVFERLASAIGLSDRQYPLPEVFWSARKLVEIVSARRPLVLVLEDLHWAEPALPRSRRPRRRDRRRRTGAPPLRGAAGRARGSARVGTSSTTWR